MLSLVAVLALTVHVVVTVTCMSPVQVSSCDDLLRGDLYRIVLSLVAVLALVGNVVAIAFRVGRGNVKTG